MRLPQATLNARTSILAAANPVGGRYDRSKSLKQNVNLTAPIMSRFDLFFILVDDCNEVPAAASVEPLLHQAPGLTVNASSGLFSSQVTDYAIARRIVDLHSRVEESVDRLYTLDEIRRYLLFARQFRPKVGAQPRSTVRSLVPSSYNRCAPADLQRVRGVHRGAVQAAAPARRLWRRDQVGLEDHGPTAGEHDPPVGGHGPHALLRRGGRAIMSMHKKSQSEFHECQYKNVNIC